MYIIKSLCWICLQRYLILYCFFYKLQYFQTLSVNIFFIFHLIVFGALPIVLHQENVHSQHFAAYYYSPGIPFHPHVPRREHGVQESTSTPLLPSFLKLTFIQKWDWSLPGIFSTCEKLPGIFYINLFGVVWKPKLLFHYFPLNIDYCNVMFYYNGVNN